ncbi:phage tail protein [Shewanella sp.]|uniref:phage tail protein n=1 Tax=Shewanella sp. TaxID=50422 RepID=UPI003A984ABB
MTQTTTKLQLLCQYLLNQMQPMIRPNQLDAWQERGQLIMNGEDLGNEGFLVANWRYTAVIQIEQLPQKRFDPYNLLAMVAAWISENDYQRDDYSMPDADIDIDEISSDNVTVTIELQLQDDVQIIPDETGPIIYNGERYRVAIVQIDVAETAEFQQKGGAA